MGHIREGAREADLRYLENIDLGAVVLKLILTGVSSVGDRESVMRTTARNALFRSGLYRLPDSY